MALFKGASKKLMSKNSKAEADEAPKGGKSIGVAYNMAKRNAKSPMSKGGSIGRDKAELGPDHEHNEMCMAEGGSCYDDGGSVTPTNPPQQPLVAAPKAQQPAQQQKKGLFARGGIVEGEASKKMESLNSAMHSLNGDDWDEKDEAASSASSKPMSEPKLDSGLDADLDEDESHLESTFPPKAMADGGRITADSTDADALDMVSAIMQKRKMMAEGGSVDLSENADEEYNHADEDNFEALKKENYSESDGLTDLTQPEDSNEHGDVLKDADSHDMVDEIRKRLKSKRGA